MFRRLKQLGFAPLWCWFAGFFALWGYGLWQHPHALELKEHLPLAGVMAVRSWLGAVAPVGSGAAGLPWILEPADRTLGDVLDFSFAVQAVAMTSAMIFVFCRSLKVDWLMVRQAALGSLFGLPLGLTFLSPTVPTRLVLALYCVLWSALGFVLLRRSRAIASQTDDSLHGAAILPSAAFLAGALGGALVLSVLGSGGAVPFYVVMLLLRRASLPTAMASCAMLMGFNAYLALAFRLVVHGMDEAVWNRWLVAAPVVCLGVPLGLLLLDRSRAKLTLRLVAVACLGQALWIAIQFRAEFGLLGLVFTGVAVLFLILSCGLMDSVGRLLATERV